MLNIMGPKVDPWGTSCLISLYRKVYRNCWFWLSDRCLSNSYAWVLMMLCQIRRHAILLILDCLVNSGKQSVCNAAYSPSWSSEIWNFSITATRHLCGLKPFRKPVWCLEKRFPKKEENLAIQYIFKDFRKNTNRAGGLVGH